MRKITPAQLTALHAMLNSTGMMSDKKEIISNFTNGHTDSSREMSFDEAKNLLSRLSDYDPKAKQRNLIFSLAYRAGIIYGDTPEDKKMNAAKLNLFLKDRGAVKKELNSMTLAELGKVHRQFEAIVKNTAKTKTNKQAAKAVSGLLDELNITTL